MTRFAPLALALLFAATVAPGNAARPLLDKHQWDAYFALFARDSNVPWKPATIRLDTYSGAPVDFAAYSVDPADVIVARRSRSSRPLDTAGRRAVVRWRFSPPPGYRFESSDVPVPLGNGEGFYVIEARRGDAVQQVWLNRTHVGLLTKESPQGLVVWAVDLRSGRAIRGMKIAFLVGLRLTVQKTDPRGAIVWTDRVRPSFALAEDGAGRAFVSLLPQAPLAPAVVGVRLESAVGRAGESLHFVGFARHLERGIYRTANGHARITLAGRGKTLATVPAELDAAGSFAGELAIPAGTPAGNYAVLASAGGGVGGTSVQIDAAGDVALEIRSACPCDPGADVPFSVVALRAGVPVPNVPLAVRVVRSPHVGPPGVSEDAPRWGTTVVYDRSVRTDPEGAARVVIPSPSDGLDSTYGIGATTSGANATSRIVVANANVALALEPAAPAVDVGQPVEFDVRGFDPSDGTPAAGAVVKLQLSHGASVQERSVLLDARGEGHAIFTQTNLGSNLAIAETLANGRRVIDAAAVLVEPSALGGKAASTEASVTVTLDKARFRPGERMLVQASAPGAGGDALITLEGARTYTLRLASVTGGTASARLGVGDAQGAIRVGAAFVRDGAIATGAQDVALDGPGHARETSLALDKAAYARGEVAHVTIRDGGLSGSATLAVRVADGAQSGPAFFDDAPAVLQTGSTSSQATAPANPGWHAYVAPARSKASDIFAAERPRKAPTEVAAIGAAAPRTLYWRVARGASDTLEVPVPADAGHFVLSVLKISDDGDVGAASISFSVE